MQNIKTLKTGIILIVSLTLVMLTGCSKDDDSVNPTWDTALVGTWEMDNIGGETGSYDSEDLENMGVYWIINLKGDGTFESEDNLEEETEETGNWETSGNKLIATFSDGSKTTFNYQISNDVLTLNWEDEEETLTAVFYKE